MERAGRKIGEGEQREGTFMKAGVRDDQVRALDGGLSQQKIDVDHARPPSLGGHAAELRLDALRRGEKIDGCECRIDRNSCIQVPGLGRSDGRRIVKTGSSEKADLRLTCEGFSGLRQPLLSIAEIRSQA
jgi:hypothetical protein